MLSNTAEGNLVWVRIPSSAPRSRSRTPSSPVNLGTVSVAGAGTLRARITRRASLCNADDRPAALSSSSRKREGVLSMNESNPLALDLILEPGEQIRVTTRAKDAILAVTDRRLVVAASDRIALATALTEIRRIQFDIERSRPATLVIVPGAGARRAPGSGDPAARVPHRRRGARHPRACPRRASGTTPGVIRRGSNRSRLRRTSGRSPDRLRYHAITVTPDPARPAHERADPGTQRSSTDPAPPDRPSRPAVDLLARARRRHQRRRDHAPGTNQDDRS